MEKHITFECRLQYFCVRSCIVTGVHVYLIFVVISTTNISSCALKYFGLIIINKIKIL